MLPPEPSAAPAGGSGPAPLSAAPTGPVAGADAPPLSAALARLQTIPGVGRRVAEALVAEVGADVCRFPTAGHLAAWAGMCPGNHESAGKPLSGTTRRGSPWLRSALVEAAHAVARSKDNYLVAQYHRLLARRGKKRALVAVGHSILVIACHLLRDGTTYHDLGTNYFDERERDALQRRLVRRLERLGYTVALEPPHRGVATAEFSSENPDSSERAVSRRADT